jgi:hypothetical protein
MNILDTVYKVVLVWSTISIGIFLLLKEYGLVAYVVVFVGLFGVIAYRQRIELGRFLRRIGFAHPLFFSLLVIGLVLFEEYLAYVLAGPEGVMYPEHLSINMVLIATFWLAWLLSWKWYIAPKYHFTEREAIMTAGFAGIMYEIIGPMHFLDAASWLLIAPLSILIYAAVAILPMQLIDFSGQQVSKYKYLIATVIPFLLTWPPALVLYFVLTSAGYQL